VLRLFPPCEIGLPQVSEYWFQVRDGDCQAVALFQRHYSCRKRKTRGNKARFAGVGETLVLISADADALFVWRKERYRLDGQEGINCAVFRNESTHRSSAMICEAMQLAWKKWADDRLFTFVNPQRIASTNPGYCFQCAGWNKCGKSKSGLVILEVFRQ
jgi:hypothetical protein